MINCIAILDILGEKLRAVTFDRIPQHGAPNPRVKQNRTLLEGKSVFKFYIMQYAYNNIKLVYAVMP